MRYPTKSSQIVKEVLRRKPSGTAFKVFMAWYIHDKEFSITQGYMANLSGISQGNISKAIKELLRLNILEVVKHIPRSEKRWTRHYDLAVKFKIRIGA